MKVTRKISRITALMASVVAVLAVASCTGSSGVIVEDPNDTSASSSLPSSTSTSQTSTSGPTVHTTGTASAPTGVTSSNTTSVPTTDSTGVITPSTTNTETISPQEAVDRAAAEKTWLDYQSVANDLWKQPEGTWKAALQKYAVDPALTAQLDGLKAFVAAGKDNWGEVVHHPYWLTSIDGGSTADLMDCVDASNAGSKDAKTGKKLSVGVAHQNTYVTLLRYGTEWKVVKVTYLVNQACPGIDLTANEEKASMEAARSSSSASAAKETR